MRSIIQGLKFSRRALCTRSTNLLKDQKNRSDIFWVSKHRQNAQKYNDAKIANITARQNALSLLQLEAGYANVKDLSVLARCLAYGCWT